MVKYKKNTQPPIKDTSEYFRKLAGKIEDKYNSLDYIQTPEPNNYMKIVRSNGRYAPQAHMTTLEQYITQAKMLQQFGLETSTRTHIDGARQWHTHVDPRGCFMCDDQQFIKTLISVLEYISQTHPNLPLRP